MRLELRYAFSLPLCSLSIALILIVMAVPLPSFGSACCGGGIVFPSVMVGDQKSQFMATYSSTEVVVNNVDSQGIWYRWPNHQLVQVMRLDAAHIVSDRWQAGFSLPLIERSFLNQRYLGVGDLSGTLGYEYLPDWDYNPFRPKGLGFLQLILPTGRSRADSQVGGLDSRGSGFLSFGAGTILTKSWSKWDTFLMFQMHHSFARDLSNSSVQGRLIPGRGGTLTTGVGYTRKKVRVGTGITWVYEDPIDVRLVSGATISGQLERFATGIISVSYVIDESWVATVSYLDQTWYGSPVNTSLGQGVMVQLIKNTQR